MNIQWIVNDHGELGVLINNEAHFMYKGEAFQYSDAHDSPKHYRPVSKREFGESGPTIDPQVDAHDWIELPRPNTNVWNAGRINDEQLNSTIIDMWNAGQHINAIKVYRNHVGCSLRAAKDACERLIVANRQNIAP